MYYNRDILDTTLDCHIYFVRLAMYQPKHQHFKKHIRYLLCNKILFSYNVLHFMK